MAMFEKSTFQRERIGLFVDGTNMFYLAAALHCRIDYVKFLNYFKTRHTFVAYAGYYTAIEEKANGDRPIQPLVDFLSANGYSLVTKMTRSYTQPDGSTKLTGNVDVDLACDMLEIAPFLDRAILVSGDGDFARLVTSVQRKGVPVTVVSSKRMRMLSEDLRKAASTVIDLADIQEEVCIPLSG